MMIHEQVDEAGELVRTSLSFEEGEVAIAIADLLLPLPIGALEAVMKRYGKELGIGEEEMMIGDRLALDEGRTLLRFRFMARYDVIARDYLALLVPGEAGLCELATSVTAALEHLARRYATATDDLG